MRELLEKFLKDFFNAVQVVRLYSSAHPTFAKALDTAMTSLRDVFKARESIVIGIIRDELTFENEIFFELSQVLQPGIRLLVDKGIERISFDAAVTPQELSRFIEFVSARGGITGSIDDILAGAGVENISAGKLSASSKHKNASDDSLGNRALPMGQMYQESLGTITDSVTGIIDVDVINHIALKLSLKQMFDQLSVSSHELLTLVTLRRYDQITYVHLLNVSILSMYVASHAGFSKADTLDIGMAGLLHDIGKMYISRKILRKTNKLTDEEFALIRNHAVFGAEILLNYVDTIGMLPVVAAFEHHVKYDLSGYPRSPFIKKQFTASGIISICDVYDALNQRRSYKSDYPPDMVYNIMVKDRGKGFDPDLFDLFFRFMGVWPIGAIIELSDSSVAVVRGENDDDIFSPVVEIVKPQERKGTVDLRQTKNTLTIAKFLNPWKEGKELLNLI
jgi:putative nucleotidyltransferase with HDIG domain